jgi:hypothetical protein
MQKECQCGKNEDDARMKVYYAEWNWMCEECAAKYINIALKLEEVMVMLIK